jgi:hypothetical protein
MYEDLRYTFQSGYNLTEAYTAQATQVAGWLPGPNPYADLPQYPSSLANGVYEITRVGSTITGYIGADSSHLISLGSVSGFTDAMHVQLFATQGTQDVPGSRSTTPIDIGFSNLTIQADQIEGVVPEPASMTMWATILAGAKREARRNDCLHFGRLS